MYEPDWFSALTVKLIMSSPILKFNSSKDLKTIEKIMENFRFNNVIIEENNILKGYLTLEDIQSDSDLNISKVIKPLNSKYFISSNTSIMDIFKLFNVSSQSFYLVIDKNESIGVVTKADLNKAAARSPFVYLIHEFEYYSVIWLEKHFKDRIQIIKDILFDFDPKLLSTINKRIKTSLRKNLDVNFFYTLSFGEIVLILPHRSVMSLKGINQIMNNLENHKPRNEQIKKTSQNFALRRRYDNLLEKSRRLRNDCIHANKPLLNEFDVRDILEIQEFLRQQTLYFKNDL